MGVEGADECVSGGERKIWPSRLFIHDIKEQQRTGASHINLVQ